MSANTVPVRNCLLPLKLLPLLGYVSLLRPGHWSKSLLAVPIGPLLVLGTADPGKIYTLGGTLVSFFLAASAVYVVNDLCDIERDRLHPEKRQRPLPSGQVSVKYAAFLLAIVVFILVGICLILPPLITFLVSTYAAINLAYSLWLKHLPIVEMLVVATGFALRVIAGYIAFSIVPNQWVVGTVLAGSLLLIIGKRRAELAAVEDPAKHRPVLAHYSPPALDAYLLVAAIACFGSVVAAMNSIFRGFTRPELFYISLPFATYIFLRYLLLIYDEVTETGNPTRLVLSDRITHAVIVSWSTLVLAFYWVEPFADVIVL